MRRPLLLLVAVALLAWGCAEDAPEPAAAPTSSTTSPTEPLHDCPRRTEGSSPATFDAAAGTYAATLDAAADGDVRFDVIQWLSGQDADDAAAADGDTGGAPNDYYIVNASPEVRTAPLAADARVLTLVGDGQSELEERPADELAGHLAVTGQDVWWLTFEAGTVVEACQQFRP